MVRSSGRRWIVLLLVASGLLAGAAGTQQLNAQARDEAQRQTTRTALTLHGTLIHTLEQQANKTEIIHAYLESRPTLPTAVEFEQFAALINGNLPHSYNALRAVQFADAQGIIRYTYPLTGNQPALGADLRTTADHLAFERALREQRMILSDPHPLVQGPLGTLTQIPVHQNGRLIGVAQSAFEIQPWLEQVTADLDPQQTLQLWDSQGYQFWGPAESSLPIVTKTLSFAGVSWQMAVGWKNNPPGPPALQYLGVWGWPWLLVGLPLALIWRSFQQEQRLQKLVARRTAELAASETRYRDLIETLPIGVFVHNGEQYQFMNPTLAEMIRLSAPQAGIGKSALNFIAPEERDLVAGRIRQEFEERRPTLPQRTRIQRTDHTTFTGEVSTAPIHYAGAPAILGIVRDVTPWVETEQRLHRLNRILRAISSANQAILRIRQRNALLQEISRILVDELAYQGVWIGDRTVENGPILLMACAGQCDCRIPGTDSVPRTGPPLAPTPACLPMEALTSHDPKAPLWTCPLLEGLKPCSIITLPILVHDQCAALLNACTPDPEAFDPEEIALLQELAGDVGFALERLELEARQREAEEALRASEGRFRNLAENAPIGITLIQDNRFRYVNPALARMYGYRDPEALVNQLSPLDLTDPEHREALAEVTRQVINGELLRTHFTSRGLRQDGTVFDVEIQGARIIHARRPAMIATLLDITEREQNRRYLEALSQAGLALSRAQTIPEALQTAVHLALQIIPSQAVALILTENGRIQSVTHRGYTGAYAELTRAFPPDLDIQTFPALRTMAEQRRPLLVLDTGRSDLWAQRADALPVRSYLGAPLTIRRVLIGFLSLDGLHQRPMEADIQRLKLFTDSVAATLENLQLVASLKEERNRMALLYNLSQTLGESLELHEVAQRALAQTGQALQALRGVLYLWNEESETLFPIAGQGMGEVDLQAIDRRLNPDTGGIGLIHWVARTRTTARIGDVEQDPHWVFIPGADDWVRSVMDVPLELHGDLIGVLSLLSERENGFSEADQRLVEALSVPITLALQNARYFTQTQQQAAELARSLERQRELDQMKDEFIQNVSHELRTPLALILGYAEMLHTGNLGPLTPEQARPIEIITLRSRMLRHLVESIAMLWQLDRRANQGSRSYEPFDMVYLTQTMVEEFQNTLARAGLRLESELSPEPLVIRGELIEIKRVLDNLLGNALKFTPTGGRIRVTLERRDQEALLRVYDTGIGIPSEKLGRIFERFYQIDGSSTRRYGGMGLGLALVKAIVESHAGRVWAESPVTEDPEHPGTCMVVAFPLI